jgi:pseudouridine-5'-phosphate glycosidase/pseudouridine kinase
MPPPDPDIFVYGSVAMDLSCNYAPPLKARSGSESISIDDDSVSPQLHTSNIATISPSIGGVGHNVALAAHLAGGPDLSVKLCSFVADDL